MAPEQHIVADRILYEAEHIADELLAVQQTVNTKSSQLEAGLLADIRNRLGYAPPDDINTSDLVDSRISAKSVVVTPAAVAAVLPLSERSSNTTRVARQTIENIIFGIDDRLLVIAGPCSIHDPKAALEYAERLMHLRLQYGSELEIIMRAYTEKPRTEVGWKGFAYDPYHDGSNKFSVGLIATRLLLSRITGLGMPVAAEPLNALTPQYVNGLVAYNGVGARNVTDQTARERASGFSTVVGFKNSPEGSILSAVQAVKTARAPHDFLGINKHGMTMQLTTTGNPTAHVILRGDERGPNYSAAHIEETRQLLVKNGLDPAIAVDASHGNSQKDHNRQIEVVQDLSGQLSRGEAAIRAVLIESFLVAGKQKFDVDVPRELTYGQSITDACVDLTTTENMFSILAEGVKQRRKLTANRV